MRLNDKMNKLKSITVWIAILLMGFSSVSCSKEDDEPTMAVSYDANCNESVKINISDIDVYFDLKYNVAGMVISDNRNDLEDMESLGYVILNNYYKRDGAIDPEIIGNVLVRWAAGWNWYFDPEHYTDNSPYSHAERNTTYYYRLFSFGSGKDGEELVNLWLHYGDIAEFTTPQ